MSNSYFERLEPNIATEARDFTDDLRPILEAKVSEQQIQYYIIDKPLAEEQYFYEYRKAIVILSPDSKILFINFGETLEDQALFDDYYNDFLEDIGSLIKKFDFLNVTDRPRKWKELITERKFYKDFNNINEVFDFTLEKDEDKRLVQIIISLLTESINDAKRIKGIDTPDSLLDKVKQRIVLFDTDQTNFLYKEPTKNVITIQGLSGTGKTELLLHKLKKLYVSDPNAKIMFTCYNKILADDLKRRIPEFFNFMKVEKQIEWESRLWCVSSWGSKANPNSGAYRYICNFYEIPFYTYSNNQSFDQLCKLALDTINQQDSKKEKFAFDYILIDESQDFGEYFIKLCERVTRKHLFVAGDIFQNIFGLHSDVKIQRDYLLNRCYRTEPKTLMFAHALSMGLIEQKKLQWMDDEQWELCGYKIKKEDNGKTYHLSRDPIRRFDEIQMEEKSIELISIDSPKDMGTFESLSMRVVSKIQDIIKSNPTIKIQDIGIISMTSNLDFNTKLAILIEGMLTTQGVNWPVNRVFETKKRPSDSLFVSNLNNVKGLEFPFVICISPKSLDGNLKYRNALYMALTRSFIQTTLLSPPFEESVYSGLDVILKQNCIITDKPTDEESKIIEQLNIDFNSEASLSHRDLVYKLIDGMYPNIKIKKSEIYTKMESFIKGNFDEESIKKTIEFTITNWQ